MQSTGCIQFFLRLIVLTCQSNENGRFSTQFRRVLLKPGTGNREPGTGNREQGTGVWERAVSSIPHKNSKWRMRKLSGGKKNRLRTTEIAKYTVNLS